MNNTGVYYPFGSNCLTDALRNCMDEMAPSERQIQPIKLDSAVQDDQARKVSEPPVEAYKSAVVTEILQAPTYKKAADLRDFLPQHNAKYIQPTDGYIHSLRKLAMQQYAQGNYLPSARLWKTICEYTKDVSDDWRRLYNAARRVDLNIAQAILVQMKRLGV